MEEGRKYTGYVIKDKSGERYGIEGGNLFKAGIRMGYIVSVFKVFANVGRVRDVDVSIYKTAHELGRAIKRAQKEEVNNYIVYIVF